jgi:WhiB family redox-sensing transcriptional regulator
MKNLSIREIKIPIFIKEDIPLCSTVDPEIFFPQEIEVNGRVIHKYNKLSVAKKICSQCPLKNPCLEYALRNPEIGVWGGTTESQREDLRKNSRIRLQRRPPSPITW